MTQMTWVFASVLTSGDTDEAALALAGKALETIEPKDFTYISSDEEHGKD